MNKNVITNQKTKEEVIRQWVTFGIIALMVAFTMFTIMTPAFAEVPKESKDTVKSVLQNMIDIVGLVFQAVGVVLSVYSVGQLVLAFKNEDADSKSRASTMLVVGVLLIALPTIVNGLDLMQYF